MQLNETSSPPSPSQEVGSRAHLWVKRAVAAVVYMGPLTVLLHGLLSGTRSPESVILKGGIWVIFGGGFAMASGVLAGMVVQFVTGAGDRRVLGTALAGLALLFVVVLRIATCA